MTVTVLHYYRLKPEYMPPGYQLVGVYVRPGELEAHIETPERWTLIGPTFHPNARQIADVEHHGFCERILRESRLKSIYKTRH